MRFLAPPLAALFLCGCQAGYYAHLTRGQYELLSRREPIARLIADPATDPLLRAKLERALDARRFATRELALPDNDSYTTYADLGRPYAVWNVFAAPELSLRAHERCYPLLGCLAYRGFYDLPRAEAAARELREDGFDVFIAGVPAYSTLGWFDDPLLNTMRGGEDVIAGTIFHELAHQVEFAAGDTAFNESFATFVEQEGLRHYLTSAPGLARAVQARQQREVAFIELMLAARGRLEAIYASDTADGDKRERKRREFERLRTEYAALRQGWSDDDAYDGWFAGELNNAHLLPFGLYHAWVPAFAALFRAQNGDWRAFYEKVGELADLEEDARRQRLEELGKAP